ncbi:MAG: DUF948 domain-containing protein [Nitrospiraceae bacterium]
MTGLEIAAMVGALALVVLVACAIPVLMQVRRTATTLDRILAQVEVELPTLVDEVRTAAQNVNLLADRAKGGVDQATSFLHAVGKVGDTVQRVGSLVGGPRTSMVGTAMSVLAGVRAASQAVKQRMQAKREEHHGE